MEEIPISKFSTIVTSFFYVLSNIGTETNPNISLVPGIDILIRYLIRNGAHKIYLPNEKFTLKSSAENYQIETYLKEWMQQVPSLKNRLELIDKDQKHYKRVLTYLEPIYKEIIDSPLKLTYDTIVNFMYKLVLAAEHESEADVSQMPFIGAYIDTLYHQIKNEEALFRLDELKGLYSIYSNPLKIENFRIHPSIEQISVYEKISDFLEEAEMIKLSKEKYFLGIPSKAKIIYKKLRSSIPKYANEHKKYLQLSMELIKYSQKVVIPENIEHILKNGFSNKEFLNYNPPLVDLDYYRVQTCKQIFPSSFPNFIFSDGATRGMTDQYFLEYYLGERE